MESLTIIISEVMTGSYSNAYSRTWLGILEFFCDLITFLRSLVLGPEAAKGGPFSSFGASRVLSCRYLGSRSREALERGLGRSRDQGNLVSGPIATKR